MQQLFLVFFSIFSPIIFYTRTIDMGYVDSCSKTEFADYTSSSRFRQFKVPICLTDRDGLVHQVVSSLLVIMVFSP